MAPAPSAERSRQITRQPEFDKVAGWVRAELSATRNSDSANRLFAGSVNIPFSAPFSESAAAIFTAFVEDRAGVFDRHIGTIANHLSAPAAFTGPPSAVIEDVDGQQVTAVQAHIRIEPTDRLSVAARVLRQETNLDGFPLADVQPDNFHQNRDFDVDEGGEDQWSLYYAQCQLRHGSRYLHVGHFPVLPRDVRIRSQRVVHQLPAGAAR